MPTPKKPSFLKVVQGTARADRTNTDEPQPEIAIPSAPKHLSKEARAEWDRIAPILESMGLIALSDRSSLAMYCQAWGDHVKAENMIRKKGMVIETPNGSVQVSPWFSISKNSKLVAHKFLVEFGLTPASRSKVSARKEESQKDPKQRFFK
jgi:P27 family predicted phage terminase small subunit